MWFTHSFWRLCSVYPRKYMEYNRYEIISWYWRWCQKLKSLIFGQTVIFRWTQTVFISNMTHIKVIVSRYCCSFVLVFQWLSCTGVIWFYTLGIDIYEGRKDSILKDAKIPPPFSGFNENNNSGINSVGILNCVIIKHWNSYVLQLQLQELGTPTQTKGTQSTMYILVDF